MQYNDAFADPWFTAQRAAIASIRWRAALVMAGSLMIGTSIILVPLLILLSRFSAPLSWLMTAAPIWMLALLLIVIRALTGGPLSRRKARDSMQWALQDAHDPPIAPAKHGDVVGDMVVLEADRDQLMLRSLLASHVDRHAARIFIIVMFCLCPAFVLIVSALFSGNQVHWSLWVQVPVVLATTSLGAFFAVPTLRHITIQRNDPTIITVVDGPLWRRRRTSFAISDAAQVAILAAIDTEGADGVDDDPTDSGEVRLWLALVDDEQAVELARYGPLAEIPDSERVAIWHLQRLAAAVADATGATRIDSITTPPR